MLDSCLKVYLEKEMVMCVVVSMTLNLFLLIHFYYCYCIWNSTDFSMFQWILSMNSNKLEFIAVLDLCCCQIPSKKDIESLFSKEKKKKKSSFFLLHPVLLKFKLLRLF